MVITITYKNPRTIREMSRELNVKRVPRFDGTERRFRRMFKLEEVNL